MKKRMYLLILLSFALLFAGCTAKKTPENMASERFQKNKEVISSELVNKYQAVTNWDANLKYTSQVQEKLIQDRPVLFEGDVKDIINRDGKSFISFSGVDHISILELESNKEITNKITSDNPSHSFFGKYIIIAKITGISESASSSDSVCDSLRTLQGGSLPCITATGTLLDAVYVNDK